MRFRGDERGQAIQIGAVLLFGVLIISLASYQAFVVPNQNEQVEFSHNQEVQQDMQEVRNAIVSGVGGGSAQSVTVDLGVRYPSRAIAVNPGPASGNLRTAGTANGNIDLTIEDAYVEDSEVGDYWNGDPRTYNTGALVYRPNYNVYQNAPTTVYDSTVLANQFREANRSITSQRLVDANTINLVTLNGSIGQASSGALSLDVRPVSASTRTVSVRSYGNLTITVDTTLSRDVWEGLLQDEPVTIGYSQAAAPDEFAELELTLDPGNYTLRMAKMGVGTSVRSEEEAYITTVEGDNSSVQTGNTQTLVAEVRDSYNNPLSGQEVNASVVSGAGNIVGSDSGATDADGRVRFQYRAPNSETTAEIEMEISGSPTEAERVTFTVEVESSGGAGAGDLTYNGDGVAYDGPDGNTVPGGVNFSLANEFSQNVTILDIGIVPQDGTIDTLSDGITGTAPARAENELYVAGNLNDGFVDIDGGAGLPTSIDIDTDGLNNNGNPRVSPGNNTTFYLYEFFDGPTNVNMSGETVDFIVTYQLENGLFGQKTYSVTPTFKSSGTSGNNPPSASIDDVQTTDQGGNDYQFTIDYSASDPDGDLLEGSITVTNLDDGTSTSTNVNLNGGSDSGTVQVTLNFNGQESNYRVEFLARDTNGNEDTTTQEGSI